MISRVYTHSVKNEQNICDDDTYRLVPNKEKIEELKNEFVKYGKVFINEHCAEPITEIHLIVQVPYKMEWLKKWNYTN